MAAQSSLATFPDISVLGEAAGFDLDFRQLSQASPEVSADLRLGRSASIVQMQFEGSFHQRGCPPRGMKTFGIPMRGMRDWMGKPYVESSILPFDLVGGMDGVSDEDFHAFSLSLSNESLCEVSEALDLPIAPTLDAPQADTVLLDDSSDQWLRVALTSLFDSTADGIPLELEQEIASLILQLSAPQESAVDRSPLRSRAHAVRAAIDLIEASESELLTVNDLCAKTGVPLRTMNRAFQERFGVGPKAYLVRRRLTSVHAELVSAEQGALVADAANHFGFWHMGQFSKDYQKLFGELPSETLSKRQPRGIISMG